MQFHKMFVCKVKTYRSVYKQGWNINIQTISKDLKQYNETINSVNFCCILPSKKYFRPLKLTFTPGFASIYNIKCNKCKNF